MQAEVIAVERPRLKGIGQRRAIGTAPQAAGLLMALQITVATLLQSGLRDALGVEEANHVGEQGPLGVDALRIGLEVQATDAHRADAGGCLRIEPLTELDARSPLPHRFQQRCRGSRQGLGQALGDISCGADRRWLITREIEIAGMGPEPEALFIQGHQTTIAIHDRAPLAKGLGFLGLQLPGPGFERIGLHQLQPGHPPDQAQQSCAEDQKDHPQPPIRHLVEGHNPRARPWSSGHPGHQ